MRQGQIQRTIIEKIFVLHSENNIWAPIPLFPWFYLSQPAPLRPRWKQPVGTSALNENSTEISRPPKSCKAFAAEWWELEGERAGPALESSPSFSSAIHRMWIALWLFCRLEQGGYSEGLATRTDALEDLQTDSLVRCNLHIQRVWVQSVSLQEDIQVRSVLVQHRWTTLTEGSQVNHMQQYLQANLFCQNFQFSFFLALHLSCLAFDCFTLQSFPEIFQLETLYNL